MTTRYIVSREWVHGPINSDALTLLPSKDVPLRLLEVRVTGLGATNVSQKIYVGQSLLSATASVAAKSLLTPSALDSEEQSSSKTLITRGLNNSSVTLAPNFFILGWNALGGSAVWNASDVVSTSTAGQLNLGMVVSAPKVLSIHLPSIQWQPFAISLVYEEGF